MIIFNKNHFEQRCFVRAATKPGANLNRKIASRKVCFKWFPSVIDETHSTLWLMLRWINKRISCLLNFTHQKLRSRYLNHVRRPEIWNRRREKKNESTTTDIDDSTKRMQVKRKIEKNIVCLLPSNCVLRSKRSKQKKAFVGILKMIFNFFMVMTRSGMWASFFLLLLLPHRNAIYLCIHSNSRARFFSFRCSVNVIFRSLFLPVSCS